MSGKFLGVCLRQEITMDERTADILSALGIAGILPAKKIADWKSAVPYAGRRPAVPLG